MLRRAVLTVLVCVCALVLITGCAKEKPAEQTAKPTSKRVKLHEKRSLKLTAICQEAGVTDKWEINLDASGVISVTHSKGNQASFLGTHTLAQNKSSALWEQVDGIFSGDIKSTGVEGRPGDTKYTLILNDEMAVGIVNLWTADVDKNSNIRAFLDDVSNLVEKYTEIKPGI